MKQDVKDFMIQKVKEMMDSFPAVQKQKRQDRDGWMPWVLRRRQKKQKI